MENILFPEEIFGAQRIASRPPLVADGHLCYYRTLNLCIENLHLAHPLDGSREVGGCTFTGLKKK